MTQFHTLLAAMIASLTLHAAHAACPLKLDVPPTLSDARLAVFGEVHGTIESPRFIGTYACQLAISGRPLIVALEIHAEQQAGIDKFIAGGGSAKERRDLLSGEFWNRSFQDGRSSEAMADLLETLRGLKSGGADIRAAAIDVESAKMEASQGNARDAVMAHNIAQLINAGAGAQVIVLVGNLHAMKSPGTPFDPNAEPAAYLLARHHPISLNMKYKKGTAWVCSTPTACGSQVWGGVDPVEKGTLPNLIMASRSNKFDFTFDVGQINASPPAIDAKQKPAGANR